MSILKSNLKSEVVPLGVDREKEIEVHRQSFEVTKSNF